MGQGKQAILWQCQKKECKTSGRNKGSCVVDNARHFKAHFSHYNQNRSQTLGKSCFKLDDYGQVKKNFYFCQSKWYVTRKTVRWKIQGLFYSKDHGMEQAHSSRNSMNIPYEQKS